MFCCSCLVDVPVTAATEASFAWTATSSDTPEPAAGQIAVMWLGLHAGGFSTSAKG